MSAATEPSASGHLDVGDGQLVYWEVVGDGVPLVWLHGGPGGPATERTRSSFAGGRVRAVIFDQRGCGRSTPSAGDATTDLSTNTTAHLVGDMERLREMLGIERWMVVGGSWGVTLGLAYAQRHPDRVLGMVLAAVTAGRLRETQWITRDMGRIFPAEWDRFVSLLPADQRAGDLSAAYARLLAVDVPAVREEAARRWCEWEDTHMSLAPGSEPFLGTQPLDWQLTFARLVTHYWGHGSFLADEEIFAAMPLIAHIPATLIHGRYDVSSPLDTAWELHKRWPASTLEVIGDAGHFGGSMGERFRAAIDEMATKLSIAPNRA